MRCACVFPCDRQTRTHFADTHVTPPFLPFVCVPVCLDEGVTSGFFRQRGGRIRRREGGGERDEETDRGLDE